MQFYFYMPFLLLLSEITKIFVDLSETDARARYEHDVANQKVQYYIFDQVFVQWRSSSSIEYHLNIYHSKTFCEAHTHTYIINTLKFISLNQSLCRIVLCNRFPTSSIVLILYGGPFFTEKVKGFCRKWRNELFGPITEADRY